MPSEDPLTRGCHVFDTGESVNLGIVRGSIGLMALFVATTAFGIIMYLRAFKKYSQRLFLYLTIVSLLHAPTYTLDVISIDYSNNRTEARQPFCSIIGTFVMYLSWLQNLIVLWITGYLFRIVVLRRIIKTKKIEISVMTLFFLVPLPFALIPLITNKYGVSGAWCWIVSKMQKNCTEMDELGLRYQLGLWFIPVILESLAILIATICIVCVLFTRGYLNTKYIVFQYEYRRLLRDSLPLLVFPIIFNVIIVFELVLDMQSLKHKPVYALWMLDAIVTPCKGILMISGYLIPVLWIRIRKWRHTNNLTLRTEEWENRSETDERSVKFIKSDNKEYYGSVEISQKSQAKENVF